ncbi:hypothetical protein [Noviherbaspirillum sedimenti]|uniref:Uncharacterized protein n=1 Tax=Noviherbaspirillum sedimenti TaxID=2320865 RepID=A0A3A3G0A5_9BURK|nr:hypothetical protein [Noviherbaspirillum sedimenti]RJG00339.1 hypothetical protein D3878_01070 [Noviherbaspirillum sedimenti]
MKPTAAQSFDLERLAELRDRHRGMLEDYRRASAAVQEASKSLARLRAEAATHPTAAEVLRKPSDLLQKFTVEQLTELQISPRTVQQIQAAESRLTRLTAARDAMQSTVARSTKFSERLEAFAKARNL